MEWQLAAVLGGTGHCTSKGSPSLFQNVLTKGEEVIEY
jgi:hypothetical protein